MRSTVVSLLLALARAGCAKTPKPPAEQAKTQRSIEDRDWELVSLGALDHPLGAGGKPATLRFDSSTKRAGGNAGCNRYNAPYVIVGDSLRFEAAMSTKMACTDGMELESAWFGAMSHVATWSATDSTLMLAGPEGPLARFAERRAPG